MNFGIVGTGLIADFHAKALAEIPGCKLVACMDTVAEKAETFAEKYSCTGYGELADFLAHPDLDIVTICTPSGAHMETAIAVAEAKKHLIVEKPIEVTLPRVDAIIEACDKNDVALAGVFMTRYDDSVKTLKEAIEAGRFGRITMGSAYIKWWRSQEYYDTGGWKGTKAMDGGGALMNQAIHAIDLLQWLMGPVDSVMGYGDTLGHERIDVEDVAVAVLRFKNGALGVIEGSTATYPGFPKRVEISGVGGTAVLDEFSFNCWKFADEKPEDEEIRRKFSAEAGAGGSADPAAIGHQGHVLQFTEIVESLRAGKKPLVDGWESRKAVEIILAIYKSIETGKEVKLPL